MSEFEKYLKENNEIGYVVKILSTLVYVTGLPTLRPYEVVAFETGEIGQVMSIDERYAEILLLTKTAVDVGTRVSRTGGELMIGIGKYLIGKSINPMGYDFQTGQSLVGVSGSEESGNLDWRSTNVSPSPISKRANITSPFHTGVSIVDMLLPIGMGQRELVVGDRKTGKTEFLMQSMVSASEDGMVCIYAGIAKKALDVKKIQNTMAKKKVNSIIVASTSSDPAGLVFLTPYTAMTIAEYFKDNGQDVLIIFDDLTTHAKYYREISLLAKRFPGRSSYPGDIFYIHSKLLERAGNFTVMKKTKGKVEKKTAAITSLPVAEIVLGDISAYIPTNLMSMTDGHLFFDTDLANLGRRPSINPFLSVTRAGRQTQTNLQRDVSRNVTSFLVKVRDLEQFMHFGTELSAESRKSIARGETVKAFFNQGDEDIIHVNMALVMIAQIWDGRWDDIPIDKFLESYKNITTKYVADATFKNQIDQLVSECKDLDQLVEKSKTVSI